MFSVYLSGPISGLSFKEASDWRFKIGDLLADNGFNVFNPLRGKSFLSTQDTPIRPDKKYANAKLSDKALKHRDKLDVLNSDIILVNLMEANRTSIGTVQEIAWAEDHNKLVVVAMPENDQFHDHPFIRDEAVIFNSLLEAIDYVLSCK